MRTAHTSIKTPQTGRYPISRYKQQGWGSIRGDVARTATRLNEFEVRKKNIGPPR